MLVDASAITGVIASEDDAGSVAGRFSQARRAQTSAVAIFEAAAGLAPNANAAIDDALALVSRFLKEIDATVGAIDGDTAAAAFDRFGKGAPSGGPQLG